jgi:hypothetical protein
MTPDSEQNRKAQAAELETAKVIRKPVDSTVESAPKDDSRSVTKDRLPDENAVSQPEPDTTKVIRKPVDPSVAAESEDDDSRSVTKDRLPGELTPDKPDRGQPAVRKPIVLDSDSD